MTVLAAGLAFGVLAFAPHRLLIMRLTVLRVRKDSGSKIRRSVRLSTLAWCRLAKTAGDLMPLRRSSLTWVLRLILQVIWTLLWRLSLPRSLRLVPPLPRPLRRH
jgi:hypothetical protein